MTQRLAGKIAVVTGGSSGFGRAIAVAFAAQGAKVVVGDLRPEPNGDGFEAALDRTTTQEIEQAGGAAAFVRCDVTSQADVANLVQEAVRQFGRLDIIVNNAGIYRGGKLAHEFAEADLDACGRSTSRAPGSAARRRSSSSSSRAAAATSSTWSRPPACRGTRTSPSTTSPRAGRPTSPAAWRSSTAITASA